MYQSVCTYTRTFTHTGTQTHAFTHGHILWSAASSHIILSVDTNMYIVVNNYEVRCRHPSNSYYKKHVHITQYSVSLQSFDGIHILHVIRMYNIIMDFVSYAS